MAAGTLQATPELHLGRLAQNCGPCNPGQVRTLTTNWWHPYLPYLMHAARYSAGIAVICLTNHHLQCNPRLLITMLRSAGKSLFHQQCIFSKRLQFRTAIFLHFFSSHILKWKKTLPTATCVADMMLVKPKTQKSSFEKNHSC